MTDTDRVYQREGFCYDLDTMRCVATLPITRGPVVRIVTNGPATIFWVDDPSLPVVTCHNTIRQAFSHAARGAGWG
jgi:hypothetical protein